MMPVLITAGATRNPIDAVRVLTARSSGRSGVTLGRALADRGRAVRLLGSPEACLRAAAVSLPADLYGDTHDLLRRMQDWVTAHPSGAVIHAAAVGDYELANATSAKIPSGQDQLTLTLTRTPKIADAVRGWGLTGPFVTFKAASPETTDEELVDIATRQRARTASDLVFANVLGRLTHGVALVGEELRWFDDREDALSALVSAVHHALSAP